jgi:ribose 5-phosphate isomerase B
MAESRSPSPDEVRALVRRIVDATLGGGSAGPPDTGGTSAAGDASAADVTSAAGPRTADPAPRTSAASGEKVSIAIGADHGGWQLKDSIARQLVEVGFAVHDCGTNGPEAVDYPDIALAVARLVADGSCRWGISIDGAGIGSAMVANKVPGIRAANCHDLSSARNSREHNHANVLTLGARFLGEGLAVDIVRVWLGTPWGAGRHADRVAKITRIEESWTAAAAGSRAG